MGEFDRTVLSEPLKKLVMQFYYLGLQDGITLVAKNPAVNLDPNLLADFVATVIELEQTGKRLGEE